MRPAIAAAWRGHHERMRQIHEGLAREHAEKVLRLQGEAAG